MGLFTDLIKRSFPCCGLNLPVDGSDDEKIICFRDGEPCAEGKDMLKSQLSVLLEPDENPFEMITESDVEDAKGSLTLIANTMMTLTLNKCAVVKFLF